MSDNTEEPRLLHLCRSRAWSLVQERAVQFPEEAAPSSFAVQGHGTTALASAVRGGAPLTVIEALILARKEQISVVHNFRGSVLHEAIRQQTPLKTINLLVSVAKHDATLLATTDDLRRNPLHYLVLRALRGSDCPGTLWNLFCTLVLAHPPAIQQMDCDGNTPLLLLLLHHNSSNTHSVPAFQIQRIVELFVKACPIAATICRTVKRQWPTEPQGETTMTLSGDGSPTPLTYALLYGQSEETIHLLLQAAARAHNNACMTLISGFHEVHLHVAVCLRSSITLIKKFVDACPASTHVRDTHNLTPIDWLWIRHVSDWCSPNSLDPIGASTRRYVPPSFPRWHSRASQEESVPYKTILRETLWQRMRVLLPAAAADEPAFKRGEPWSMLHAASCVPCPLLMVRLAVRKSPPGAAAARDLRNRRLPLHYAAARPGYHARVPVGAALQEVKEVQEESPVGEVLKLCPGAVGATDASSQLPLHIAIDADRSEQSNLEAIQLLLEEHPESIERRDGKTMLYPFQQAATSVSPSISTIYFLLQQRPTLVSTGIRDTA